MAEYGGQVPGADGTFVTAGHALAEHGGTVDRANPANVGALAGLYRWLQAEPGSPALGGGRGGLAGFNHPGREPGRFGRFAYDAAAAPQVVSLEVFNRREDYLFEGLDAGQPSPIVECLNAGWKVGLNGVTDEHGTDWGAPRGKGRCGLWVATFDRDGIKDALQRRRFFATNQRGLRLDVEARDLASGATARMGEDLRVTSRPAGVHRRPRRQRRPGQRRGHDLPPPHGQHPGVHARRPRADRRGDAHRRGPRPRRPAADLHRRRRRRGLGLPAHHRPGAARRTAAPRSRVASAFSGVGAAIAYASPFYLQRA